MEEAVEGPSPEDPVADEPGGPSVAGRWLRRVAVATSLVGVAAICAALALVWPYVRDDLVLDRVVLAVALDWRDFGRDKAQARLEYELDHQRIGLQVSDEHCALVEDDAGLRTVRCAWTAEVRVPMIDVTVPIAFGSAAEVGPDGALR